MDDGIILKRTKDAKEEGRCTLGFKQFYRNVSVRLVPTGSIFRYSSFCRTVSPHSGTQYEYVICGLVHRYQSVGGFSASVFRAELSYSGPVFQTNI